MDVLHALRLLAVVADCQSFSGAGRRLDLSTSAVARQMDALERHVGRQLLARTTRRISLTETGARLLSRSQHIVDDLDATLQDLRDDAQQPRGLLRVTAAPSVGRAVLPPLLAAFAADCPEVQVDLVLTDGVLDLEEDGIDVAVRAGALASDPDVIVHDLRPLRRVLCAAPDYLAAAGTPGRPEQLARHACLLFRPRAAEHPWQSPEETWVLTRAGTRHKIAVDGPLFSTDADALVAAARAGMGIVMMPDWLVAADIVARRLVRLLPDWTAGDPDDAKSLHLAYPVHRRQSPKVTAFCRHLQAWFDDARESAA